MIKWAMAGIGALLVLTACDLGKARDSLDAVARDYVEFSLTIGEKEEGYIDAYYGPPEIQAKAKAAAGHRLRPPQLIERTDALRPGLPTLSAEADGLDARRARFLTAQLTAAQTRLRMLAGEKLSFEEEALGLFGVRPRLQPLTSFDPVLAKIEALVPGSGPLAERVEAFQSRFTIPPENAEAGIRRRDRRMQARTIRHIALPEGEKFDLAFVTGKSWSGYNYYQGSYHSRIEVNTDLPIRICRAVDLGCHEGYPGHHVLNCAARTAADEGPGLDRV